MPVIEWADWQAAQGAINSANKAVSGLTPAQAEAALSFQKVTLQDGTIRYVMNSGSTPPPTPQVDFNTGAIDAAYEYVNSGGQVSQTGAAVAGSNVAQSTNMAMTQTAGGITSVGALLSVNLPTAAAALAPIAGVALGAGLYSLNPDLWDKISRTLLPFCYEGTELLPVVADENGVTYFPKEAVDAVKSVLSDITTDAGEVSSELPYAAEISQSLDPYPFSYGISKSMYFECSEAGQKTSKRRYEVSIDSAHMFFAASTPKYSDHLGQYEMGLCIVIASEEPFITYDYRKDQEKPLYSFGSVYIENYYGKNFYYYAQISTMRGNKFSSTLPYQHYTSFASTWVSDIAYAMLYGNTLAYPEGTSAWTGVQYPINPEGIGVVTQIVDGQPTITTPYYPVTMPVGDPGVSPSPTEVPEPGKNPEIAPAVNPWLTPKPGKETYPEGQPESDPAKIPDPVPDTDPNLNPNANPSQAPQPQPEPAPDPAQSTKPGNSGNAPLPIIPVIPTLPSAASGLLHVYNPSQSQLDAFGSWLWTTFSGDLIDTLSKLFNDPMDAVIGLHELYATPAVSGSSTIRAGFLDSKVPSNLVGSRYTSINCGSIVVQEYYQNYLDYSPYTKCYIYLPFIGIVPVLADDIIGNAVNVTYNIDSYTGCCIAVVTVAREGYSSTVYQFEGNCAVEIPITSGYQSTLMSALIGAGATALTGNPHAGIAAANMGRASLGKNDVSHSGSFGSSFGAMGAKVPYIIVKRPTQKSVVNYNQDYGFPAHKRVTIGVCSGYLRAREVHVISPTATDDEKSRIEELLKEGVFVK